MSKHKGLKKDNKEIKLKEVNSKKYCLNCGKIMPIEMKGMYGYCCSPNCHALRYTILNGRVNNKK